MKLPGTDKEFLNEKTASDYLNAVKYTDGLSLGQICTITGLEPMIIQNWIKRGYVAHPVKKKYHDKQFARILLINALKEAMIIEDIGKLMTLINGDVDDESDDLISESDLYLMFALSIYHLDRNNYDLSIRKTIKSFNIDNEKLFIALQVMVNSYIAAEHKKVSRTYFKKLENI